MVFRSFACFPIADCETGEGGGSTPPVEVVPVDIDRLYETATVLLSSRHRSLFRSSRASEFCFNCSSCNGSRPLPIFSCGCGTTRSAEPPTSYILINLILCHFWYYHMSTDMIKEELPLLEAFSVDEALSFGVRLPPLLPSISKFDTPSKANWPILSKHDLSFLFCSRSD